MQHFITDHKEIAKQDTRITPKAIVEYQLKR